jgi:alanyl-tRNA synthetase
MIRQNISLSEFRTLPISEAKAMGAMALFGEKYGDTVRVIKFGESIELCGGTHVQSTGEIGHFKIVSESAIAAGIRRIEAISSLEADAFIESELQTLNSIRDLFKNPKNILQSIEKLSEENSLLKKEIEKFEKEQLKSLKENLLISAKKQNGTIQIISKVDVSAADRLKDLAFQLKDSSDNVFVLLASISAEGKVNLVCGISDKLSKEKSMDAGKILREVAKEVQGGGGGQATIATAGGKNPEGINNALLKASELVA